MQGSEARARILSLERQVLDLSELVCMLARAHLAHEYGKDLCRAGPIEAFSALGNDEDIPAALSHLHQFKGER